jgi:type I restriction enzyme S subunit
VAKVVKGKSSSTKTPTGQYPLVLTAKERKTAEHYDFDGDAVLVPLISSTGHGKADIKNVHMQSGKFAAANLLGVILPDKDRVNARYLHAFLDHIKDDIAKSKMSGSTNVSMNIADLSDVDIVLPPLAVQNRIADEIENKQRAIESARDIIEALERERRYFDPRPIAKREGWPMKRLGEVLDYEQPTKYIVNSIDYRDDYKTPVLTAGKSFILGNTNEETGIYPSNRLPVIIFDDFTTAIKFVDFPFKVKSSAMKILRVREGVKTDIKYIFNAMLPIKFKVATHKRHWISEYSNIEIPIPPLEAQRQFVVESEKEQKVISANHSLIELMTAKIHNTLAEVLDGSN